MNGTTIYFKKIHHGLERGRSRALREYDVTGTQMDVLDYLHDHEDETNTLTELASSFGVKHTSMIHILKLLETKDLILRKEEGTRSKPVCLTEHGKQIMQEVDRHKREKDEILYQGFTEEEQTALRGYLERVYRNIRQCAAWNGGE